MHFVPCDIKEANPKRRTNDIRKLLTRIIESREACVEIKDFAYASTDSLANVLQTRIRKDRLDQLRVVTRDKRVFVINTLFVKDVK